MVAKIDFTSSISRILHYHEKKVLQGKAACIYAGNFLQDPAVLRLEQKIRRFQEQIQLNERAKKTVAMHVSLNFHPEDKLDTERKCSLARAYMEKIGFGKQPFLVYEHCDAGHPHLHLVSTTIQSDGRRIQTHNLGPNLSVGAARKLEAEFNLIGPAGSHFRAEAFNLPATLSKFHYGQTETFRSIAGIVNGVINSYTFSCLQSFNAILKQYNVWAECGSPLSQLYRRRGILYFALDGKGHKVGAPVKASAIPLMPTLFRLEQKFREQTQEREEAKGRTRLAIDWSLAKSGGGFAGFRQWLERERLSAVLTNRRPGHGEEIIFVDFNSRQAFRGDELGLRYTSPEIGQRLAARSLQIRAVAQAALKISRLLDASPVRVEGISRNEAVGKEDQPPLQLPARLVQGAGLPPAHGSGNESQIL